MKKKLICLILAWVIFFPNSFYAHDIEPDCGFKATNQDNAAAYHQLGSENFILDIFLEDIFEDDDSDNSEKKKISSGATSYTNTYFVTYVFSDDTFKNILPTKLFFPFRASLFIWLCVFRL